MKLTLAQVAQIVGGEVARDTSVVVTDVASLSNAGPGDIAFATKDRMSEAADSKASALIVPERIEDASAAQIIAPDPYLAFSRLLRVVERERHSPPEGVHPTAVVGEAACLAEGVCLGAHAVVGARTRVGARTVIYPNVSIGADCVIGADTLVYSNVAIRERVNLGDRVVIHSGTSIGGDGFGYIQVEGRHVKVPQVGRVQIGDDVEIGCNCTIDRATMDHTVIGSGVKIDNHSHVAHNCRIGENTLLIAYARMGGGTVIGRNVLVAEDVGITDNVTIGDGAVIAGSSKVSKDIPPGAVVWGYPAQPIQKEKRQRALQRKLPEIWQTVRQLKRRLLREGGVGGEG